MHDSYFHYQFFLYIFLLRLLLRISSVLFFNISLFSEIKFTSWEAVHNFLVSLNFLEREWMKAVVTETNQLYLIEWDWQNQGLKWPIIFFFLRGKMLFLDSVQSLFKWAQNNDN